MKTIEIEVQDYVAGGGTVREKANKECPSSHEVGKLLRSYPKPRTTSIVYVFELIPTKG